MKHTLFSQCSDPYLMQTPKTKLFLCILHLKRVNLITLLLLTTSLLLADIHVETRYVAAQSQPDCGSTEDIKLPCWRRYLESGEGDESLPLYPYAKRPNGCSIPGSSPGSNDSVNIAGINISFTDICNKHDRCYYTTSTTASDCNDPFQNELRARCEREIADHAVNGWDIITLGMSRATAFAACETKAIAMATAVIGTQGIYHKEAHDVQEKYKAAVAEYVEETKCSPLGPMPIVYVDAASTKTCERGNEQTPFRTLKNGVDTVHSGGTIFIQAGSYAEGLQIDTKLTLIAKNGSVTIGLANTSVAATRLSEPEALTLVGVQDGPSITAVYLPLITHQSTSGAADPAEMTGTNDTVLVDTLSNTVDSMRSTDVTLTEASITGQVVYLPLIAK